jgi:hypothetical protein
MTAGGFSSDPEAIYQLASGFDRAAERLSHAIAAFSSHTGDPPAGAFGVLPLAQDAYHVYLRLAQEAVDGLRSVHTTLGRELAEGLRTSAANYVGTDEDLAADTT